jgi:hypothetical protein
MPLQYLAGQRLTADQLQRAVPDRVVQENDQSVTSSIAPVASEIVITVDDLTKIDLEFRWQSNAGGIRWDWAETGTVTFISRFIGAPGNATSGSVNNIADMTWRQGINFATDIALAHYTTGSIQRGSEVLTVEGAGTLTFRFAQETSNAAATTVFAGAYAVVTRLGS